ncbi:MAG: hypothetical protein FWD74_09885, partial [Actinomycetia bacterium]|nr:hypothetical protein [Actinomycetes bacterium]
MPPPPGQWDPAAGWDQLGAPAGGPAKPRHRGRLLVAAAAVVVLIGGGATYVAVANPFGSSGTSNSSGGASSPNAAAQSLVTSLNKGDYAGMVDDLVPAERDALKLPMQDLANESKQLDPTGANSSSDLSSILKLNAQSFTFDPTPDKITDNVEVVKLTGGTLTYNMDLSKSPAAQQMLQGMLPGSLPAALTSGSVDISQFIKDQNNGEPIRIATQKVGDKWYPSLFYTIADNAANSSGVTDLGAPVPANGASSPQDLVTQLLNAVATQDSRRLIELTSPDEMAALHDYGSVLLQNATAPVAPTFKVTDLSVATKTISGGATRVTLQSITVQTDSMTVTVKISGGCLTVSNGSPGTLTLCANDVSQYLDQYASELQITPDQEKAIAD